MNAIVEKTSESPYFQAILSDISASKNVFWLQFIFNDRAVKKIALENGFKFGFGGSHFWVADAKTDKRLILVPFE